MFHSEDPPLFPSHMEALKFKEINDYYRAYMMTKTTTLVMGNDTVKWT